MPAPWHRGLGEPDLSRTPTRCNWHLTDEGGIFPVRTCKRRAKVQVRVDGQADYHGDGFCRQHGRMAQDRTVARIMNSATVTVEEVRT